ncbi:MAG: hypothetical protein DRH90_21100 [Deltaproteobacteria bacterium]|nr:MAG: hypothetical protein DRH90_21100 [Deltaproteobacteria bacterium]
MRWKWFVTIGVLTIVISIAAAYVYLITYDYNELKPLVARMVEDATGRKLSLGGDINLEIGFAPALVVTDAALANATWGSQPQMIEIEKLQAQVRLVPLLFKNVKVKYISLAGVKVLLETGPKAQGNWNFLTGSNATGSIGIFEPNAIEVSRVSIENLHFTFHRHQTASPTQISIASLALIRKGTEDTMALNLEADYNGQQLRLSGKTGRIHNLLAHKRFPLQLSGNLANTGIEINGAIDDVLNLQGVDAEVQLAGKNFAALGSVLDLELTVTDQFEIQGHLTGSGKALTMKNAKAAAILGSLHFTANGVVQNLLTLNGMDLQSRLNGKNLEEFGKVIGVKLPATDEFEIQGRLTGSTEALTLQRAQGSARRGSMRLSLTGTVKDLLTLAGMDLQSRLSGKELAEIGTLFETELPGLGPFDINAKLSGSANTITLNEVSATVDKSDFAGLVKFEFRKRPKITIGLESSMIDFTALMKSLEQDEQKTANKSQQKDRMFSDDPLPLDFLEKVDADIVLNAENIHAKDVRFELGHLTLKLEDSDFKIDKFEASHEQTKFSGKLHINHGSPTRINTNFLVQNFDLGRFHREIGLNDQVQGTVDLATHLNSKGDSVHSLMANLDGAIGIVMGQGYLIKYLDMLSVDLSSKIFNLWGNPKEVKQIQCAVIQFDIKSGVAASKAFVFNTRAGILEGEGEINLGTEKIDFLLMPTPRHPGLLELGTNLRVGGTILDAKVKPDKLSVLKKGALGLSSFVIGPLGLLAPFVHLGAHNAHPCNIKSIGQLGLQSPATQ